jgi:hypothetical protein
MSRREVELIPRNVLVDVKMASMHMQSALALFAVKRPAPLNHFDELLERSRRPLPQAVYTVVIRDDVGKKTIEFELSGNREMQDQEVHDYVAGLNKMEEGMVEEALRRLQPVEDTKS